MKCKLEASFSTKMSTMVLSESPKKGVFSFFHLLKKHLPHANHEPGT